MTVNYYLQPDPFDPEARDYFVKVHPTGVYDLHTFIREMVGYHSSFTEADFYGMFKVQTAMAIQLVLGGCHINTPLYNIRPTLRGRVGVNGLSQPVLTPGATLSAGKVWRAAMRGVDIFRLPTGSPDRPAPLFYVDDRTHKANKIITLNGRGQLLGERMRFDPDDPNQGIYLIDRETGVALKAATAGLSKPALISIIAPAGLVAGRSYVFEVRTRLDADADLRSGRLVFDVTAQGFTP